MLARVLQIEPSTQASNLKDIKNSFAKGYISAFQEMGIIGGYSDGTFKPTASITRAEIAVILDRLINVVGITQSNLLFTDLQGHWSANSVQRIADLGVVQGTTYNKFSPNKKTTRAESIVMLVRFLKLNDKVKEIIESM
ncbi:Cellulosome-anchoring protein precursor [compost metagenome]